MPKRDFGRASRIAIKKLRKEKLSKGSPFMINSPDLPSGQCWLEYPDGYIHLVTLSKSKMDFDIIKILSIQEADVLKRKLGLE